MKKAIFVILIISIIALSSCGSSDANCYNVEFGSGDYNSRFFKEEYNMKSENSETYDETENFTPPVKTTFFLGKCEITAYLTSISTYRDGLRNCYQSKDGSIQYIKYVNSGVFYVLGEGATVLCPFKGRNLTEYTFLKHIKDYLSAYIDLDILDKYEYTCTTLLSTESGANVDRREYFCVPKDDTEIVKQYHIEYIKYSNGIKTSDSIVIVCDSNGDILEFRYYDYGVDWSTVKFDSKTVDKNAERFIDEAMKDEYSRGELTFYEKMLVYRNSEIQVSVTLSCHIDSDDLNSGYYGTIYMSNKKSSANTSQ